jgi:YfiH family protein
MEQKNNGKIYYFEPAALAATGVAGGFTTRHEGVSRPPYNSLNLGSGTQDLSQYVQGNRSMLARAFGTTLERMVTVTQVHGADLLVIDQPNDDFGHFTRLECDGIVTNQPNVMIGVCVADCVPVLLYDPRQQVVAALHAGWKGTAANIVAKGVAAMAEVFDSRPADIHAAIGPAIGPCCYEVDTPVKNGFATQQAAWDLFAQPKENGKWQLDLTAINRHQLLAAGLADKRIDVSNTCVCCTPDSFFSFRREKGETGRQMGFIMLR